MYNIHWFSAAKLGLIGTNKSKCMTCIGWQWLYIYCLTKQTSPLLYSYRLIDCFSYFWVFKEHALQELHIYIGIDMMKRSKSINLSTDQSNKRYVSFFFFIKYRWNKFLTLDKVNSWPLYCTWYIYVLLFTENINCQRMRSLVHRKLENGLRSIMFYPLAYLPAFISC